MVTLAVFFESNNRVRNGEKEIATVLGAIVVSIFSGFIKLALLAGLVFYAGLVLVSYYHEGVQARPQVNWNDPPHALERLSVWAGVGALAFTLKVGNRVLGMLSEASAEVGEWFLSHRHHESH